MFDRKRVVCTDWYETEQFMWMCLSDKNAICKANKETGDVQILGSYPGHGISQNLLSSRIVFCNGKIVFVPCLATSIAIVDVETDEVSFLSFPQKEYPSYEIEPKFLDGFVQDGYVYITGCAYPAMLRINPIIGEVECVAEFDRQSRTKYAYFGRSVEGGSWLFSASGNGELMRVSLETKNICFECADEDSGSIFTLTQKDDRLWMTCVDAKKNYVLSRNMNTGKIEKIGLAAPGRYYAPVFYQGIAYFFPQEGKSVVMVDTKQRFKSCICDKLSDSLSSGDWANVMAVKQIGTTVKYVTGGNRCWYEYDLESHVLVEKYYEPLDESFCKEWEADIYRVMTSRNNAVVEKELALSEFLHVLGERTSEEVSNTEKSGKKIYEALKDW